MRSAECGVQTPNPKPRTPNPKPRATNHITAHLRETSVNTINSIDVLTGLTNALRSLLPTVTDADLQPTILISPTRIVPTGLGGFVGTQDDPKGEVVGRRLEGTVLLTVKGRNADALNQAVTDAIAALVGANRSTLLQRGILQISLNTISVQSGTTTGGAPAPPLERTLAFHLLYEFLKLPTESEELIQHIPINLEVG